MRLLDSIPTFIPTRYVGDRLVVRLQTALSEAALEDLNQRFSLIVKSGKIEQGSALKEEQSESELADLPRIILRHRRRDFGLLREFINALNEGRSRKLMAKQRGRCAFGIAGTV